MQRPDATREWANPYFRALAREKRICPECLERYLRLEPAGGSSRDVAVDECDCGYSQVRVSPPSCCVGRDPDAPVDRLQRMADELNARRERREWAASGRLPVTGREGNIIRVDFKARRAGV